MKYNPLIGIDGYPFDGVILHLFTPLPQSVQFLLRTLKPSVQFPMLCVIFFFGDHTGGIAVDGGTDQVRNEPQLLLQSPNVLVYEVGVRE